MSLDISRHLEEEHNQDDYPLPFDLHRRERAARSTEGFHSVSTISRRPFPPTPTTGKLGNISFARDTDARARRMQFQQFSL